LLLGLVASGSQPRRKAAELRTASLHIAVTAQRPKSREENRHTAGRSCRHSARNSTRNALRPQAASQCCSRARCHHANSAPASDLKPPREPDANATARPRSPHRCGACKSGRRKTFGSGSAHRSADHVRAGSHHRRVFDRSGAKAGARCDASICMRACRRRVSLLRAGRTARCDAVGDPAPCGVVAARTALTARPGRDRRQRSFVAHRPLRRVEKLTGDWMPAQRLPSDAPHPAHAAPQRQACAARCRRCA